MRYSLLFVGATFLLGGCALPVSVQVASWAMTGLSYATTGKGISDHAFSAVAERDCAMHRVALGEEMCNSVSSDGTAIVQNEPAKPAQPTERLRSSMIALAENLDTDFQPVSEDMAQPLNTALVAMADTLNKIDHDKEPAATSGNDDSKNYLVIGQYRAMEDAEKVRLEHADLGPKIRMILEEGTLLYQVTAGPFNQFDAEGLEAKFGKTALSTRVALSCANGGPAAACGSAAFASLAKN